jgi:hypothetical protein
MQLLKVTACYGEKICEVQTFATKFGNPLLGTCAVLRLLLCSTVWLLTESAALHILEFNPTNSFHKAEETLSVPIYFFNFTRAIS